jgi:hypothetical protein
MPPGSSVSEALALRATALMTAAQTRKKEDIEMVIAQMERALRVEAWL